MSLLTPMTAAQAREIGALVGVPVAAVQPLARGVNSNFRLELSDGTAVFARVHEAAAPDVVAAQCRLTDHLAAAGVPTPRPLRRREDGQAVFDHLGKPTVLFPFVPGRWSCQASVDERRARRVGAVLAQIHRAGVTFAGAPDAMAETHQLPRQLTELGERRLDGALASDLARLGDRLTELRARGATGGPTVPVIHGDLFRDNVLWAGDELSGVLDFERAGAGCPVFDLMVTVLAWCFGAQLDQRLARALVAGYQQARPLSEPERARCYDQARLGAVRWAVGRVVGYELQPPGVIAYKDYRRFLTRLDALEQIGARRFLSWLTAGG